MILGQLKIGEHKAKCRALDVKYLAKCKMDPGIECLCAYALIKIKVNSNFNNKCQRGQKNHHTGFQKNCVLEEKNAGP